MRVIKLLFILIVLTSMIACSNSQKQTSEPVTNLLDRVHIGQRVWEPILGYGTITDITREPADWQRIVVKFNELPPNDLKNFNTHLVIIPFKLDGTYITKGNGIKFRIQPDKDKFDW